MEARQLLKAIIAFYLFEKRNYQNSPHTLVNDKCYFLNTLETSSMIALRKN